MDLRTKKRKKKQICPNLHVSQNVLECLDLLIILRMYSEDLISAQTTIVSSHNWRQCDHERIFYSIKMSLNKSDS